MAEIPAGWYDDGSGAQRYWDGTAWTEHVVPSVSLAQQPPQTAYGYQPAAAEFAYGTAPAKKRLVWPWVLGGSLLVVLVLVVGGIVAVVALVGSTVKTVVDKASPIEPGAAVLSYNDAWIDADCDLMQQVTTAQQYYSQCDDFAADAESFNAEYTEYVTVVTSATVDMETATVVTHETYLDYGEASSAQGTYTLNQVDGAWKVSDVVYE